MPDAAVGTSKNVLERVWLAYAWEARLPEGELDRRIAAVRDHYQATLAEPFTEYRSTDESSGVALLSRPDPRLRWPLWTREGEVALACAGVPTGWERIVAGSSIAMAPSRLADALAEDPARALDLNPPFVLAIHHRANRRMHVVGDALGVGRLYQLRTERGWVWSNRLGALPLFAEERPELDETAWRVFAAAGWFLGSMTPIRGTTKVKPGSIINVRDHGERSEVTIERSAARDALVQPRKARLKDSAAAAAEQVTGLTKSVADAWDDELAIAITGGRDSRVSAAAALAAGVNARFNTGDQVPGELDVVRELISRAPVAMDHEVRRPELEAEPTDDLLARTRAIHLMHDGMRNPQEVRRSLELPHSRRLPPHLSGHGGELGHGFYYHNKKQLKRIERGGETAMMERLEAAARRRHSAAVPLGYEEYLDECRRTLESGRAIGLGGPVLLDWFYLAQRLAYRSGIGSREGRYSACVTPAFVRGCFDLRPKDRLSAKFHREVVARLVPEWRRVDFFSADSEAMPEINRRRIWERPDEAAVVDRLLHEGGGWEEIFDPDALRRMWSEVRSGEGSADYEHVFYRLVWRAAFEEHLSLLDSQIVREVA
jgi:hypothetical protein